MKKNIAKQLKNLPNSPGVYIFKDAGKNIVYIGRAASLKNRVRSYFIGMPGTRPAEQLINKVKSISVIKTSNLLEAAVLENNLIKKYLPTFNIRDKDDKSYVYLFFDMNIDFPKPVIIRTKDFAKYSARKNKKIRLVGPFSSSKTLKDILHAARKIFPYSACVPNSGKPCFHYQIGLCPGSCVGEISPPEYKKNISGLIKFLNSKNPKTGKVTINDSLLIPGRLILPVVKPELKLEKIEAYDISYSGEKNFYGAMVSFFRGKPDKNMYRLFKIRFTRPGDDTGAIKEIIERRMKHREWPYPDIIIVDGGRNQTVAVKKSIGISGARIPVVGISKSGKHSASSSKNDKLVFGPELKPAVRELLRSQKSLLQAARNEAHRFSLKHSRLSSRKNFLNK